MRLVIRALALALVVSLPSIASAEVPELPPAPDIPEVDAMVGTWQGSGTVMGMSYTETITWEWVLGHRWVKVTANSSFAMPDGTLDYSCDYYQQPGADGTWTGHMFDSMGSTDTFTGVLEGSTFTAEWDDPVEGPGRIVMTRDGDTLNSVLYHGAEDGSWNEIGTSSHTRQAN